MASSINTVAISGNLTRDAEARETANGNTIISFTVAVSERRKNPQSGEWENVPNYIGCTWFGNYAKAVAHDMKKGAKVAAMGHLRWSQWQTQDGTKREKVEVIVDHLEVMTRGQRSQQAQPQDEQTGGQQPRNWGQAYRSVLNGDDAPQPDVATVYDDEIPF